MHPRLRKKKYSTNILLDNKQIFIFFILWIVGMHQLVDSEVYYLQYISV